MRTAKIERNTQETKIKLELNLDGTGVSEIKIGCGFLEHMLTLFSRHGRFDLKISCNGDTDVDFHHSTEDIAICLGKAFAMALGEKRGITRYADTTLPMDESLVLSSVDISGRGELFYSMNIGTDKVGDWDTELNEEFWHAFSREAGITLHIRQICGTNAHHIVEGAFKSVARSLKVAVEIDEKLNGEIPSTKGVI